MSDTRNAGAAPVAGSAEVSQEIKTVFNKSTSFRVIYADGIWYEGDQNGNLHLIFYNERGVLPKAVLSKPIQQGNVIGLVESKRIVDGNIDREIECEIVMSFAAASQLRAGLGVNLENIQKVMESTIPEPVKNALRDAASMLQKETAAKK